MNRFELLDQLSRNCILLGICRPVSCADLAKQIGNPQFSTPSGRANLATRLRRLWTYGLARRKKDRSAFPRVALASIRGRFRRKV